MNQASPASPLPSASPPPTLVAESAHLAPTDRPVLLDPLVDPERLVELERRDALETQVDPERTDETDPKDLPAPTDSPVDPESPDERELEAQRDSPGIPDPTELLERREELESWVKLVLLDSLVGLTLNK